MKPVLAALAVAAVGLAMVLLGSWRNGIVVIGVALTLAAVLRVGLPADKVGDLAARSKPVDALLLTALGFALIALANTIGVGR